MLTGCFGHGEGEPPPILDDTSGDDSDLVCGGVPPDLVTFTAEPAGLWQGEQGTDPAPAILLSLTATDEDKDLSEVRVQIWFDDYVDGVVDTGDSPWFDRWIIIATNPCLTSMADMSVHAQATNTGALQPNTWYDFVGRVSDAMELESEFVTTVGGTPKEDGTDPDPRSGP